ncbi:MAG: peptidoglycan-binding domain-containing protein [Bacteroidota bacterium]
MKRLFYLVIIITLPLIAFFEIWSFYKHNVSADYDYQVNDSIDPNYHNPELVSRYYVTAKEVGNYARNIWKEHRVDVTMADMTDPDEKEFGRTYNSLIASAKHLERKLLKSAELKGQGMSNEEIVRWEQGVQAPIPSPVQNTSSSSQLSTDINPIIAQIGDNSATVREIQDRLYKKGSEIRIDGIFREETKQAVAAFQKKKKLPETGIVDIETFLKLMK